MKKAKLFMALLRMAVGWYFLYQGIVAITTPGWTVLPAIQNAQTFPHFYAAINEQPVLGYISYIIEGLFSITGILLILGLGTRFASLTGIAIMLFFYFPLLHFPKVGSSFYIIDEHMIIVIVLIYFFFARANEYFGLGSLFKLSRY